MRQRPVRRYAGETPLDVGQLDRRGTVVRLASEAHSTTQEALAYLNSPDAELGGRPLDLATRSAAGLAAVEQALNGIAARNRNRDR